MIVICIILLPFIKKEINGTEEMLKTTGSSCFIVLYIKKTKIAHTNAILIVQNKIWEKEKLQKYFEMEQKKIIENTLQQLKILKSIALKW